MPSRQRKTKRVIATHNPKRAASMSQVPDEYIPCKLLNHDFEEAPITEEVFADGVIYYQMICQCKRCFAERKDIMTPEFEIWSRGYKWVDNYLCDFPATKPDWRREKAFRQGLKV